MTDRAALRNWLFKGVAAEVALDGLEEDGLAVRASSDPRALQRVLPLETFSSDIRQSAMKALPAYLAFFCFENAVRELISERLSETHGSDWWETCVPKAIKERVQSRQEKEGKNRWHVRRGESEVYYTDFGDLKLIIQKQWEDFTDLFPDQNWIVQKLDELEASRNVIAHSNVLDKREIQRIRLYLEDWVQQVG